VVVAGIGLISIVTPIVSATVRERWFQMPEFIALLPIPLMSVVALLALRGMLNSSRIRDTLCWLPFALLVMVFLLGFFGLAYSLYPFVVMDQLTIWQAASSPAALKVILIGVAVAVPAIAAYTVLAYRVFGGKATALRYA
jgi:cytochrome d ubiquinol oxidase subunit II